MALANFFDKAVLAASQVLSSFDRRAFEEVLIAQRPAVAFDGSVTSSAEGRSTLELTVNLLARMYPQLLLIAQDDEARAVVPNLERLARGINPVLDLLADDTAPTATICVGMTRFESPSPVVYVGSEGWTVRLALSGPVGSGRTRNPFGAGAAACIAVANLFRHCFGAQLHGAHLDERIDLSLFELAPGRASVMGGAVERAVDIGETHLVGIGAIGESVLWALSRMPDLTGRLRLVDGERLELSNLQRYVLASQVDIGKAKVDLGAEFFQGTPLQVMPYVCSWGEYLASRQEWRIERVAVAVDSAHVRCAIQAALPRRVLNAWTQPENLGISRHDFLGDGPCLMCLYMPEGQVLNEDELIRNALGLPPEAIQELRSMLARGTPVGREFIERVSAGLKVPSQELLRFKDKPLRAFYADAVCGGILLALQSAAGGPNVRVEVPLAFQSALAGILLAAELVFDASGIRWANMPATTTINLLRPLGGEFSFAGKKHWSGQCICQDEDYISLYCAKYETQRFPNSPQRVAR